MNSRQRREARRKALRDEIIVPHPKKKVKSVPIESNNDQNDSCITAPPLSSFDSLVQSLDMPTPSPIPHSSKPKPKVSLQASHFDSSHVIAQIKQYLKNNLKTELKDPYKTYFPLPGNPPPLNTEACQAFGLGMTEVTCNHHDKNLNSPDLDHARFLNDLLSRKCGQKTKGSQLPFSIEQFLFHQHFSRYMDFIYPCQTFENTEVIREAYVAHVLNHVISSANLKNKNTKRMKEGAEPFQDHGFTRPSVLILAPFRHCAYVVTSILMRLGKLQNDQIDNSRKFMIEFGEENHEPNPHKPNDFNATFEGNVDDCFRIGIALYNKTLKLYSEFYNSDIIIASPLGLRLIMGDEANADFLSSIEILILDSAEIFLMQNMEHLHTIFKAMNVIPKETRDTDFSRLSPLALAGQMNHARQTICISKFMDLELEAFLTTYCQNQRGKMINLTYYEGQLSKSSPHVSKQVFRRFESPSLANSSELRFAFFCQNILPIYQALDTKRVLIYIPSYYDYIRIRNYMNKNDCFITCINEYNKTSQNTKAREMFKQGEADYLLYTERAHFFRRFKLRGVKHVLFYGCPTFPHFYTEILALLTQAQGIEGAPQSLLLLSRWDLIGLERVAGSERAKRMIKAKHGVFVVQ